MKNLVKEARDVAVTLWQGVEPGRPKVRGSAARATSRPPDGQEEKAIMMPQSKKRPETSRSKSVAPPIRRELSAREKSELAARTAELKAQAAQKAKDSYEKERKATSKEAPQSNGAASASDPSKGHDLTEILIGIPEDQAFKQVVFLCLARLYAVFCPSEIADIQTRITEQSGQWRELLEKETNRFLS